jgi:rod shape-determining protein MreC
VKSGDLLVTSGLGGVFPAGYPVARIAEVHRDAVQPLAQVRAVPLGRVELDREVMLVWFRPEHPAAPGSATMADSKGGNAAMQPLPAPPKPKPAAPEQPLTASPATAATPKSTAPKAPAAAKPVPPAAAKPSSVESAPAAPAPSAPTPKPAAQEQ